MCCSFTAASKSSTSLNNLLPCGKSVVAQYSTFDAPRCHDRIDRRASAALQNFAPAGKSVARLHCPAPVARLPPFAPLAVPAAARVRGFSKNGELLSEDRQPCVAFSKLYLNKSNTAVHYILESDQCSNHSLNPGYKSDTSLLLIEWRPSSSMNSAPAP